MLELFRNNVSPTTITDDPLPITLDSFSGNVTLTDTHNRIINIGRNGHYKTNIIIPEGVKVYFELEHLSGNIYSATGLCEEDAPVNRTAYGLTGYNPRFYPYTHEGAVVNNNRCVRYYFDTAEGNHFFKIGNTVIKTGNEVSVIDNPLKRQLRIAIEESGRGWGSFRFNFKQEHFIYGVDEDGFIPLGDLLGG